MRGLGLLGRAFVIDHHLRRSSSCIVVARQLYLPFSCWETEPIALLYATCGNILFVGNSSSNSRSWAELLLCSFVHTFVSVSFHFPDMRTIGSSLAEVLDVLMIPYVIGMGEGAGANILARFGMDYPEKCLGLILIHCTSTQAGVMEFFRDKVSIF